MDSAEWGRHAQMSPSKDSQRSKRQLGRAAERMSVDSLAKYRTCYLSWRSGMNAGRLSGYIQDDQHRFHLMSLSDRTAMSIPGRRDNAIANIKRDEMRRKRF